MRMVGGIVALTGSLLAIAALMVTLPLGELLLAFSQDMSPVAVRMTAFAGTAAAALCLVFSALLIGRPARGEAGLIVSAALGVGMSSTLVSTALLLCLLGGILATLEPAGGNKPALALSPGKAILLAGLVTLMALVVPIPILEHYENQARAQRTALPEPEPVPVGGVTPSMPKASDAGGTGDADDPPFVVGGIGSTLRDDWFETTLNKVTFSPVVFSRYGSLGSEEGTVFALLHVTVRCIDTQSRNFIAGPVLAEIEGQMIPFESKETILDMPSPERRIHPYTRREGVLVYRLPKEVNDLNLVLWIGHTRGPGRKSPLFRFNPTELQRR